jgi:S1-C subfamily serine protease
MAPGDVIHGVNRTAIAGLPELRAALDALDVGQPAVLQLERQGALLYLPFTVE